jgi:glycosyltransferase involved in cell wall biosynthesis
VSDAGLDVSVIIPTRSRWARLSRAALPSALGQEGVRHEVIVVDDGSADETPERLAALDDPRLRVVRHEVSQGVARARNGGIAAARGKWVSFLDDDDLWSPHKLRRQLDAAAAVDATFAYAAGAAVDGEHRYLFSVAPPQPDVVADELLRWNVIWCGCSNVMALTDVVRRLGGFDERLVQLADWDLWIRLALSGPAASVPDVVVAYTMHDESMLLTDPHDVLPEMDYLVAKHRDASYARGIAFDRALFARWVARGHRRGGRRWRAARAYLRAVREHRDVGGIPRALASLLGDPVVELARRVARSEQRSRLRKLPLAEPDWIARFRT